MLAERASDHRPGGPRSFLQEPPYDLWGFLCRLTSGMINLQGFKKSYLSVPCKVHECKALCSSYRLVSILTLTSLI